MHVKRLSQWPLSKPSSRQGPLQVPRMMQVALVHFPLFRFMQPWDSIFSASIHRQYKLTINLTNSDQSDREMCGIMVFLPDDITSSINSDRHMKALPVPSGPSATFFMYDAISKRYRVLFFLNETDGCVSIYSKSMSMLTRLLVRYQCVSSMLILTSS